MTQLIIMALFYLFFQSSNHPHFEDYPVPIKFNAKPTKLSLNKEGYSRRLLNAFQKGAAKGPNYADHYTIIQCLDGTTCYQLAIANAATGEMYEFSGVTCGDLIFNRGSRLLIYEPIDSSYYHMVNGNIPSYQQTRFYIWNDSTLQQIDSSKTPLDFPYEASYNIVSP